MKNDDENFCCEYCDYKSNKHYNILRHMIIKHIESENINVNQNNQINNPNNQNVSPNNQQQNQCEKCEKILSNQQNYKRHCKTCKGKINPLQCHICNEVFTTRSAKSKHQKNCKIKKEEEQKASIQNIEIQNNIQTQNNTTNNITNNNITNNNTINIINFSNDLECEFVETKQFQKKIKKLLAGNNNEITMIKYYNRELFAIKENQCIKKTNLRSSHSQVHIGDNKWIVKPDKEVYPQMVSSYANNFSNLITKKQEENRNYHKRLGTKLDYLIDNYINGTDEEQKELNEQHKELQTDLKVFVYNNKM